MKLSSRALVERINRKLSADYKALNRADYEILKKARPRWWNELGDYYVVDACRNQIVATNVDIEDFGRELGVLTATEIA